MPVSITRLRELISLAATEGVGDIDIVEDGTHIRIRRSAGVPLHKDTAPATAAPEAVGPPDRALRYAQPDLGRMTDPSRGEHGGVDGPETTLSRHALAADIFTAPMFGVFHLTSAPGAKPYVGVGDTVTRGQQLCLIEAMKMFNTVQCDRAGRIEAILAEPGSEVANGQPLFHIVAG